MNKSLPILLILDPSLKSPCIEAINCISKIMGELKSSGDFKFSHFEYVSPFLNKVKLKDFILNKNVGAVIGLGSILNVTDNLVCVEDLAHDLAQYVFKKGIAFFGICFSHQMFAAMHGYRVSFIKKRYEIKNGKHNLFRMFQVEHPKLALLATKLKINDYFSNNKIDLNFKEAIKTTKNWDKTKWDNLRLGRDWTLTALEYRIKQHIHNHTLNTIISHARHEQEVFVTGGHNQNIAIAGTSDTCIYESLVHNNKPLFTIQTHPETNHESCNGYLLLKNFIYMSSLLI